MNEFTPKVSIVIPVYNGANYLREAIDSALAQTYENVEVIVINDGSTDDGATERIALSYGDRIRYFRKENGGVATALNLGINVMIGDYFSWLSHDDVYYPDKIEVQIDYLRKGTKDVVLYGDYDCIDMNSNFLHSERVPHIEPAMFHFQLLACHPINGCTTLVPKSCFDTVGLFNEELRVVQDYEMWFRLARRFDVVHMPRVVLKSRLHPGQGTVTMAESHFNEKSRFYSSYFREVAEDGPDSVVTPCLLKTAIILKRAGFYEAAREGFDLAMGKLVGKPELLFVCFPLICNYKLSKSRLVIVLRKLTSRN